MTILLLKCPNCGNQMKYMPKDMNNITKKTKQCVYCGKRFNVFDHLIKREK